ncbi:hypothetical protein BX600DRAFT_517126 [Xylariales sp. PMI_506]|nr:hypothetical protein BX600DRAFT_517126 [Xylariales sp. PMI_506]
MAQVVMSGTPDKIARGQDPGPGVEAVGAVASVHELSVRRERSIRFREFGLYASKLSSLQAATTPRPASPPPTSPTSRPSPPPPLPLHLPASSTFSSFAFSASSASHAAPAAAPYAAFSPPIPSPHCHYYYPIAEEEEEHHPDLYSPSHASALSFATDETPASSPCQYYDFGPRTPTFSASPPISPRWDSLARSATVIFDTTQSGIDPTPWTPPIEDQRNSGGSKLLLQNWTLRDEFPLPNSPTIPTTTRRMNTTTTLEARLPPSDLTAVGNFSRPRRPSIKQQPSPESLRFRRGNSPSLQQQDPPHLDISNPSLHHLWPRERGQSTSSNQSTSTFASLPVRPSPDMSSRDGVRGRSRQAFGRAHMAYRTESSGPAFSRDPIPRMASLPSDELRSSFRSQLSASTAQGTALTERSSVLTKSSSITSIYGPGDGDDGFSVDDIMGMYEKGFRDDSPAPSQHDDDSRPATAVSELSRRRTAMLEAMSDSLPIQYARAPSPLAGHVDSNFEESETLDDDISHTGFNVDEVSAVVRNSVAILLGNASATNDFDGVMDKSNEETSAYDPAEEPSNSDNGNSAQGARRPSHAVAAEEVENIDETRDRYGFRKANQYVTQEQYDEWNDGYSQYMDRRRKKWQTFLKENGLMTENPNRFPARSTKTKRFIRKGIPPEWRGAAWFYYSGGPAILAKHGGVYDGLLAQKAKDVDNEAIERDLHRTFPDNLRFRSANASSVPNTETAAKRNSQSTLTEPSGNEPRPNEKPIISSLRRVLHAFSIYNPRIGYCQSLNFLAGLLLLFVETEEQAFWLLNIITRVYLPGTHDVSLEGANVDLGVLMTSLREVMPAVWGKIGGELDGSSAKPKSRRYKKTQETAHLPPVTLCMTAWFMSCFIGTLPIETTLRVWDVFFYEGSKTLFRIALTIFKVGESEIRSVGDPMEIFQVVQTIPRRLIDANALVEACFKRRNGFGHLSQETIEQRRMERRMNVKLEKERATTGLDDVTDFKRKNTLFGRKKKIPTEVL